ncbi:peptidylprolyl isomerase [Candidatus Sumerlaeota bacterium]|nr:peptidylprolyl isomerase [Candidatus Sumerlaeota bacterium]
MTVRFRGQTFLLFLCLTGSGLLSNAPVRAAERLDTHPALFSKYRGAKERILARAAWGDLSEADLYRYLLVSNFDTPLLFQRYEETVDAKRRAALRKRVERAIETWAATRMLATESAGSSLSDPLSRTRVRMLTYPVHELVWIERCLEPRNVVAEEDVQKYYNEHPSIAWSRRQAHVRCIFLKVPPNATIERWERTRQRILEIRDLAMTRQADFADLARRHSQATSAAGGGLLDPFSPGTYFESFERQAFMLEPGEIGLPIRAADGFYLLQGQEPPPQREVSTDEARKAIRERLYFLQLRKRHEFALAELVRFPALQNRAHMMDLLYPDSWVLKAGALRLTKDQVWDLFPEFVGPDFEMNKGWLARHVYETGVQELVARFNEKKGWDTLPVLTQARHLAADVVRAMDRFDALVGPTTRITPEQAYAAVRKNPKTFRAVTAPRFSVIQVRLLPEAYRDVPHRQWLVDQTREALAEARDRFSTVSLETVALEWPVRQADPWQLVPSSVLQDLSRTCQPMVEAAVWNSTQSPDALLPQIHDLAQEVSRALGIDATSRTLASEPDSPDDGVSAEDESDVTWLDDESSPKPAILGLGRASMREAASDGSRFLPIVEGPDFFALVYIEQPNFQREEILDLVRYDLRAIAVNRVRTEKLDEILADRCARARLEILVP